MLNRLLFVSILLFAALTTLSAGCRSRSGQSEQDQPRTQQRNVLKEYINTPKDKAGDAREQLEQRNKTLEEQLNE